MLSITEFTVGTFHEATALSLVLPRSQYEIAALIGTKDDVATAVLLSPADPFRFFESAGNDNWSGLIVPRVRIEVDERSAFDPDQQRPLGAVIRSDTSLSVLATNRDFFGRAVPVALVVGLTSVGQSRVGFMKWEVVIGEGHSRRVLWTVPTTEVR